MTIWERTKAALSILSVPMAADEFMGDLPAVFLVYNLVSSVPEGSADNRERLRSERMQVAVYSQTGLDSLPDVAGAMVAAGFTRGPVTGLPYDQTTRHYGLAYEFVFLEDES